MQQSQNQSRSLVQTAMQRAFERVDHATLSSRQRDGGAPDDDYQRQRYLYLRDNPKQLMNFVAESLGSHNPDAVYNGAIDYLNEMEGRYA